MTAQRRKWTNPDHSIGDLGGPIEVLSRAIREVIGSVQELLGYPAGHSDIDCEAQVDKGRSATERQSRRYDSRHSLRAIYSFLLIESWSIPGTCVVTESFDPRGISDLCSTKTDVSLILRTLL